METDDCGKLDDLEWNVFVKIALSVLLISYLGGCFMLFHCLRFGRGYTGVMVGILSVTHIVSTLCGVILECLRLSGRGNRIHLLILSSLTSALLQVRLIWSLCMAITSLWMIRSAMRSLSKLDITEESPVSRLSWKVWTIFACATITLPIVFTVVYEETTESQTNPQRYNNIAKLMAFSVYGIMKIAAHGLMFLLIIPSFVWTYQLYRMRNRRHSVYRSLDVTAPHLRSFLFLLSSIIGFSPVLLMYIKPVRCNPDAITAILAFAYVVGLLDCIIYCTITVEVRRYYSKRVWLMLPHFVLSPFMIPHTAFQFVKKRRDKRISLRSPLLSSKRLTEGIIPE